MADIEKPQYHNPRQYPQDRQIYQVNPERKFASRPSSVPNTMHTASNVFDSLISSLGQYQDIYLQSEQTANRLQAKNIIINKLKHHEGLLTSLDINLQNTAPEHISLKDIVEKIGTRDQQNKSELYIGENLDVNISPMMVPDDIPDAVKDLVEEQFIRMDTQLLQKILSGVEQAQTRYDTQFLNAEQKNFRVAIKSAFRSQDDSYTGKKNSEPILEDMMAKILERSTEGGTLDRYETSEQMNNSIQTILQEWYLHDMRNPNIRKHDVIEKAERGLYKWGDTHVLDPEFYQTDVITRNNLNERNFLSEEKELKEQDISIAFESYKKDYRYGRKWQGETKALNDLLSINVKPDVALNWVSSQIAQERGDKVSALETELNSTLVFNKRLLWHITKPVIKNGKRVKDKNDNNRLVPKQGEELIKGLKKLFGERYTDEEYSNLTERVVNNLIVSTLNSDRQDQDIELTADQTSFVKRLGLKSMQPKGSATILSRFAAELDGEIEYDSGKILFDPELIDLFGEHNLSKKVTAVSGVIAQALRTHNAELKKQAGDPFEGNEFNQVLSSIQNEYIRNAKPQLDAAMKGEVAEWEAFRSGNKRTRSSNELLKENSLIDHLDGMMEIGKKIIERDLGELSNDIDIVNSYPNSPFTDAFKLNITTRLAKRIKDLNERPSELAIEETGQTEVWEKGEQLNMTLLSEWKSNYGTRNKDKFFPEKFLEANIGLLTDQGIDSGERFKNFQNIYGRTAQFGGAKTQNMAKWELRQAIKGNGTSGNKQGNPALAFLIDIWDDVEFKHQRELFSVATTKLSAPDDPKITGNLVDTRMSAIKEAIKVRHQNFGIKSTLQSIAQIDDLSVLEEKMLRARAYSPYYSELGNAEEIAKNIHKELFPNTYVLKTGRRYNVRVNKKEFERNGLAENIEEHAKSGQAFLLDEMDRNGATWTLLPSTKDITTEILTQKATQESLLNVELPKGVRRYRTADGQIMERVDEGEPRPVYSDRLNELSLKLRNQTIEDIVKGNSKNLRKGLINVGDGYEIGVYLVDNDNEHQSVLIGKFFEIKNGKKVNKFISERKFVGASGSSLIVKFLNNPKFMDTNLHEYVRELRSDGIKKSRQGILAGKVSEIPFFRLLENFGKLEFDHAIEPLYSEMERVAKSKGKKVLNYQEAKKVKDDFISRQDRWYKKSWLPQFVEDSARFISDALIVPY